MNQWIFLILFNHAWYSTFISYLTFNDILLLVDICLKYTICIPKPNAFLLTKADPFYMEKLVLFSTIDTTKMTGYHSIQGKLEVLLYNAHRRARK